MIIIGRLTRDAVVNQLKDEREVLNFSIAVNDFYKPKGSDGKQFTTFYNCSYWINSKLAKNLKKGCLVEVSGRIYVTSYNAVDGSSKVSLNCHVNQIKIHTWQKVTPNINAVSESNVGEVEGDDLPF
jgi:single-strand DNA-binding protein